MSFVRFFNMETGEVLFESDSVKFDVDVTEEFNTPKMPLDLRLQGSIQIEDAHIDVDWLVNMISMYVTDVEEYRRLTQTFVDCKDKRKKRRLQRKIMELFKTK